MSAREKFSGFEDFELRSLESMTVIENINIAYVSQDLSLFSSADADGTKDLRYLSVFAIGCIILPLSRIKGYKSGVDLFFNVVSAPISFVLKQYLLNIERTQPITSATRDSGA